MAESWRAGCPTSSLDFLSTLALLFRKPTAHAAHFIASSSDTKTLTTYTFFSGTSYYLNVRYNFGKSRIKDDVRYSVRLVFLKLFWLYLHRSVGSSKSNTCRKYYVFTISGYSFHLGIQVFIGSSSSSFALVNEVSFIIICFQPLFCTSWYDATFNFCLICCI